MKNILSIIFLGMLLTSCNKETCSTCSYIRPDNNAMVEAKECFKGSGKNNGTWEETFQEEVRALGGDWANLEISCERYIAE